jgi:hypothetical protein
MDKKATLKAEFEGTLTIGDRELSCAVLEDGTRVFSMRGLNRALGSGRTGTTPKAIMDGALKLPPILAAKNLQPYIGKDLAVRLSEPIQYQPMHGGRTGHGYEATLLPGICYVLLDAKKDGALKTNQHHLANAAEILVRGFAHVGIVALVDEATGYQEVRDRIALQQILDKYLTDEWAKWTKVFPDEFYQELFRLRGIPYPPPGKHKNWRPSYVGHWTNDIVYSRLAPGVLKTLRELNPRIDKGYRKRKHHQYMTRDYGDPALKQHLANVIFLMRTCRDWRDFKRRLEQAAPKMGKTIPLPLDD